MIWILQAGRFVAAMSVVIHHAIISVTAFVEPPPVIVQTVLKYGYLGVDFFFVLSGFIIHYTMRKAAKSAGEFAYDRVTRIMLPYWPIGILLALAYLSFPGISEGTRGWGWLSTLTLVPSSASPALSVAWTLQHELIFYLLYAVLFYAECISVGLGAWAIMIVASNAFGFPDFPLLSIVFAMINLEFIAGAIAAELFMRQMRRRSAFLFLSRQDLRLRS